MYKIIYFCIAAFISSVCFSQDTITIQHRAYKTTYSKSKRHPVMVEWWLTKQMLACSKKVKRTDDFKPDPKIKLYTNIENDYEGSGYDRGHVFPASYAECSNLVMAESFYYSNIIPQTPELNRGDWKVVEELTKLEARKNDSVYVWAGAVGERTKIGFTTVPKQCWKVIYVKKTNEYFAFIFDNNSKKPNGIRDNKTTVETIEKLTGFKFKIY
jgi:endonuclease G